MPSAITAYTYTNVSWASQYSEMTKGATATAASSTPYQKRCPACLARPMSWSYEVLKVKRTSDLLAAAIAEQARGPDHQHEQHHDVRHGVLESLGQVEAGQGFSQADHQPTHDGARKAAEAAHDGRRESLQPDEAHVGVHEGQRSQQQAGERGHRGGDGPHQAIR